MIDINSIRPSTVTVLIGPNGSGKSQLMRKLCASFLRGGDEVIAIAPTIHDRFKRLPKIGFQFFGARQGRNAANRVIRSALERASSGDLQIFKNLTRALEYTKFEPFIGISLSNLNFDNFPIDGEPMWRGEAEELRSALLKWQNRSEPRGVIRLTLNSFSFEELDTLTFAILARHEDFLYRHKIASRIKYFLYRDGDQIPLLDACSGEICFITTIAFIATQIGPRSVIAIDEPDTSLHPTWQQNYVRTLLDLFHYHEPRILISTHSPIIISGAEATSRAVTVYEMIDGNADIFAHTNLSLEEMYDRLFGLITPKNHYLSQCAVRMLNELNSGDRDLGEVLSELEDLRTKSYDESQRVVIGRFEEMARRLDSMRQGGHV